MSRAKVPGDAGRAQDRPGDAERDRLLRGDDADTLRALAEDRLLGEEDVVLVEAGRDQVEQAQHVVAPARRQVGGDTTGPDVVVVHPQAGDLLEEPQQLFTLAPAVDDHRHCAEIQPVRREEEQMRRHAVQLGHQHADPHRPRRHLDAEQLLGRQAEDQLVRDRRHVVHAGDVGRALQVGELLRGLLHAGVEVADDRLRAQHRLAVELEHEPQHTVGAGVLRPHVDDHRLIVRRLLVAERVGLGFGDAQDASLLAQQLLGGELAARRQLLRAFTGQRRGLVHRGLVHPGAHRGFSVSLNCTGMRPTS